ncbi:MAG: hypothetical protein CVV64_08580 [Candidatus Wallbacteria bacterium HGW-Wallbacteria-1]|jgi:uncharacterized membrane protein required for colicin V production|uniref:CvpA family protein n=1 Tax=Candidatus Wallbacteria bacterium HGW-Wallbacteria-1 TaxID=2013854 RepID=A0A2N1PQ00_9BACT|nr:MAG: hypothetical protein CVV64_08580 [Candidatus Wallbacteria bacterium HGW-Wallbacteria-1]
MDNFPRIFDASAYLIVFLNLALGIWRGFILEIGNLLGVLISLKVALQFRERAAVFMQGLFPESIIPHQFLGFFTILFVCWLLLKVIFLLITKFTEQSKTLTAMNRLLGGLLGGIKGSLILGIILLPIVMIPVKQILGEMKSNNPDAAASYPRLMKLPEYMDQSVVISNTRKVRDLLFEQLGPDHILVRYFNRVKRATVNVSSIRQAVAKRPEVAEQLVTDEKIMEMARTNPTLKNLFQDPDIRAIIDSTPRDQVVRKIMSSPSIMPRVMKGVLEVLTDDSVQGVVETRLDKILADCNLAKKVNSDGSVTIVDSLGGGITIAKNSTPDSGEAINGGSNVSGSIRGGTGTPGDIKVTMEDGAGGSVDLSWAEEILRKLLSDKKTLEAMYASKQFDGLARKSLVKKTLSDPAVKEAIDNGNYSILYFNKNVKSLLVDPQIQSFLKSYAAGLK